MEPRQRASPAGLRPTARHVRPRRHRRPDPRRRPSQRRDAARGQHALRSPASAPGSTGSSRGSSRRTSSTTGTRRTWAATDTCAWPTRASCSRSGTAASCVKITEREIKHRDQPVAYLWQRWFIIVRQPTRTYPPATSTTRSGRSRSARWSRRTSTSRRRTSSRSCPHATASRSRSRSPPSTAAARRAAGRRRSCSCRPASTARRRSCQSPEKASPTYFPVRQIQGRGQTLAVAKPVKAGDTSVEVSHLVFDGEIDHDNVDVAAVPHRDARRSCRRCGTCRRRRPLSTSSTPSRTSPTGCPPRALDAEPVPGTPNAGELILALKSPPAAVDFTKRLRPRRWLRRAQPVRRGHLPRARRDRGERQRADGVRCRQVRPGVVPLGGDAQAVRPVQPARPARRRWLRRGAGLRVRRPGRRHQAAHRGAASAGALDDAQARLAKEVAEAAHDGAKAVAQHAKDELDARAADLEPHLDALDRRAYPGLPGTPGGVNGAAATLLGDLQPLLDALGCARTFRPPCAPRWRSRYRR